MSGAESNRGAKSFAAVLGLAVVVRLAWALVVPMSPVSDSVIYDGAARRLAQGLSYTIDAASTTPSAHWPVGTSFMYSLVYRIFDPASFGYAPVVALNLIIGVVIVGLSMRLASRWFGTRVGIFTGTVLALWPMHIEFTTVIASEPIFTACILGGLLLSWPKQESEPGEDEPRSHARAGLGVAKLALAGILFAAATYARPTALLIPMIVGGIRVMRERRLWCIVSQAAIVTGVMLVAIAPWTIRNYRVFHTFVLVSTNGGSNMWMGNNPDTTGFYQPIPVPDAGHNEATWDAELGKRAKSYIKQDPAAFVKRSVIKAVKLHDRETIGVAWNKDGLARLSPAFDPKGGAGTKALKALSSGYWYVMLLLAAGGFVVLVIRVGLWKAITHPTVVLFAYFTAVHAVMVIQDRYHFPITPMVAALASVAISAALGKGKVLAA